MNSKNAMFFIIAALIVASILIASGSPKSGDILTVKWSIDLSDGDQVVCSLKEGQQVEYNRTELSSHGSSETIKRYWVTSVDNSYCWGSVVAEAFKKTN